MRTLLAQDLGLIDTTGRRLALTVADFVAQYRQRPTWRYLSLVLVVLVASDPVSLAHVLPFHAYVLASVLGIGWYFGSRILLMLGVAALRRRLPRWPVYWPLISLLALGPTLIPLACELEFSLGIELRTLLLEKMLYLLVTVVMFEGIFVRFAYTPCPGIALVRGVRATVRVCR